MEPTMINLKILSTAAALALVLPMAMPSASFAQHPHGGGRLAGGHPGGGGGHPGGFHPGGGGARFSGGGYRGGHGGGGGFIPGAVAGALVGGAIAAGAGGYGYYGGPGYDPGYYGGDPGYYDDGAVAVAPAPAGDDGTAYCMQRFRSYDPQSGTYMGNDGYRHPCP
jgi:BA14K-like protein